MKRLFRTHYRDYQLNQPVTKKMDESEGMCRDEANYSTCWGRICNPNRGHVLKDILRGLLVLIVLAIVITVIFLLCYFLLNDIEKKEDEVIDNLVKDFSAGGSLPPNPEILTKDINQNSPSDTELYDSGPLRGDVGKEKEEIRAEEPNNRVLPTPDGGKLPAVTVFAPSSPSIGNNGENVRVVKPPFLIPEVHATTEEVPEERNPFPEVPPGQQGFIPVRTSPPSSNEGLPDFNFNQDFNGQNFDNFSDFVVAESGSDCVPLRLPLCSTMPWTLTAFPNWVNNNNMRELQESLKYFQSTIIGGRCSAKAAEYSCAILEPACGPDGIPLPPCKAFCEDISRTCSEYLTNENKHRIALHCDRFPDSNNPNVCVDVTRDVPKEIKKIPEINQFTPAKVATEKTANEAFETIPEVVQASDGETTELPVFICDHTKFLCEDGSDCLPPEAVCDGTQNCLDNSDEANCTAPEPDISEAQEDIIVSKAFIDDSPSISIRRPSLSEMLSGSSLVAAPEPITEPPTPRPELKLRFSSDQPFKSTRGKSLETKPLRNSFEPISPIITTPKPISQNDVNSKTSKLSLAALLSTSIKPNQRQEGAHSQHHPVYASTQDFDYIEPSSNRRSLSDLLASASFTSSPTRVAADECPELQCLDGKCISVTQLNDGIDDCTDGADEQ